MLLRSVHTPRPRAPSRRIASEPADLPRHRSLRLLTFNIQGGIHTGAFHHYVTRGWQHLLPHRDKPGNLRRIARLLQGYDIVALQEVDGGSLRSGFVNQVDYLAEQAHFPYCYQQLNRNLGKLAQHSNGLLSRPAPSRVEDHRLPGFIPGRGTIIAHYGEGPESLVVVLAHLSLSRRAQQRQLAYIHRQVAGYRHLIVMGDLNNHLEVLLDHSPLGDLGLVPPAEPLHTFPSWQPRRSLDHILVSPTLEIHRLQVLRDSLSDHLPIAMEIGLPESLYSLRQRPPEAHRKATACAREELAELPPGSAAAKQPA